MKSKIFIGTAAVVAGKYINVEAIKMRLKLKVIIMMKKSFYLLMLLLLSALTMFTGCGGSSGGDGSDSGPNQFAGGWIGEYEWEADNGTVSGTIDTSGNFTGTIKSNPATGNCDKNGNINIKFTWGSYTYTITGTLQKSNDKLILTHGNISYQKGSHSLAATLWPSFINTKSWEGTYTITNGLADTGTIRITSIDSTSGSISGTISSDNLKTTSTIDSGWSHYYFDGKIRIEFDINPTHFSISGNADLINGKLVINANITTDYVDYCPFTATLSSL